jgi:hypothetical protein
MGKLTRYRQFTGLLSLAALLLQLTLPFFAVYSLPAPAQAEQLSKLFGGKILICTEQGFRFVSADELAEQQPTPHPQLKCALCYLPAEIDGDIADSQSGPSLSLAQKYAKDRITHVLQSSTLRQGKAEYPPAPTRAPPLQA